MSVITVEPFETMSLPALRAELAKWQQATAPGGFCADLQIAHDIRDLCGSWVERRTREATRATLFACTACGLTSELLSPVQRQGHDLACNSCGAPLEACEPAEAA